MEHMYFDCYDEQKALVTELVGIRSVVGSEGCEQRMAEHIRDMIAGWEYFKDHPGDLFLVPTDGDTMKRSSVVAVVEPECGSGSADAVLLMGHLDTVETSDYGSIEPLATRPEELKEALRGICGEEVDADIESGKFMFGRGALDMKAGVACYLYILRHFSRNRDSLRGSLIALFECDEEGDSHGMLTSVEFIKDLARDRGLNIIAALCADYSSTEPAVYLGTIGKYLPCAMAFGRSSHVGQVFSSVDPNLVISEIISAVDYNTDLCEESFGEMTQPPVSLKQSDLKQTYSVQTADSAYAYFNWFSLRKTEEEILETLKSIAEKAADNAVRKISEARASHRERLERLGTGVPKGMKDRIPMPRVMTLAEYADTVGEKLGAPDPCTDIRRFWVSEAMRLRSFDRDMSPAVIVFNAGVSYPPVTVDPDSGLGRAASGLGIPVRTYYPFISDASFVSLLGEVPLVNLGTYGKDAHMFTERVDMDYSFRKLPNLTWDLLLKILGKDMLYN
ncbi:MAG: M20/M25/M40 family metallo-hydrolase [Oscillospiraceae bacterium]|nr:M20/M25/M40 family metallo-hydrolase [Oscillospiraceae bacterium]